MRKNEINLIMPQSFTLIKDKIATLEDKLAEIRLKKGEFGKDGDPWDDPVLYDIEREEKILMKSISDMKFSLNQSEAITIPNQISTITLGHRIRLKLLDDEYSPQEGLHITLVSEDDALVLSNRLGFDEEKNIIVSKSTPLGNSILGAKKGDTVRYNTGEEVMRAKIENIEISPLFLEA